MAAYLTHCHVHIAVGEDDERRFASQFQGNPLEVGQGTAAHHIPSDFRGSRKAHFAHVRVIAEGLAHHGTCPTVYQP